MTPECKEMLPGCAEAFGELGATLKGMSDTLEHIDKALNGNGQPGLLQRVTTLEVSADTTTKRSDRGWQIVAVLASIAAVAVAVIQILT